MEMPIEPGSIPLSRSLSLRTQIARTLFVMSLMGGVAVFWLSPHPPMIDLPQHAGQIALLRDILLRRSIWDDRFYLNFYTPYFLSYLICSILATFTPVAIAIKLVLSFSYVAFVYSCIKLRRQFGGDG